MTMARVGPAGKQLLLPLGLLIALFSIRPLAQAPAHPIPPAATGDHIDPVAATNAYLASMPADKKARSDAYFEGGYWLQLWGFLVDAVILLALLHFGVSARIRSAAVRMTRPRPLQTAIYAVAFALLLFVLSFPWSVYTDFFREHQYGLSTQTFGAWMGDTLKGLAGEPDCAAAGVDGALRRASAQRAPVVDLGRARHRRVDDRRRRDRPGLHRAHLQHLHAAEAEPGSRRRSCAWRTPTASGRRKSTRSTPRGRPRGSAPTSAASSEPSASR